MFTGSFICGEKSFTDRCIGSIRSSIHWRMHPFTDSLEEVFVHRFIWGEKSVHRFIWGRIRSPIHLGNDSFTDPLEVFVHRFIGRVRSPIHWKYSVGHVLESATTCCFRGGASDTAYHIVYLLVAALSSNFFSRLSFTHPNIRNPPSLT